MVNSILYNVIVSLTADSDIGRLAHALAAVEPAHEVALLRQNEHGGRDAVHGHDQTLRRHRQTRHDVDETHL